MKRLIKCIITGNSFIAAPKYWEKKIKDYGSEDRLHRLYVCQKAKSLLLKKNSIEKIRSIVECTGELGEISPELYEELYKLYSKNKINKNITPPVYKDIKEDPEVTSFIERLK
jgi:hypothetical protein